MLGAMTLEHVDDAGWGPELWDSFNELAAGTVNERAQLRRVIPAGADAVNAYVVEVPQITPAAVASGGSDTFEFDVRKANMREPTRIRVKIKIKAHQLHDSARIRNVIEQAAMMVARVEDTALAHGPAAAPSQFIKGADADDKGLFGQGGDAGSGDNPFGMLALAIDTIRKSHHTGHLRAVFGNALWKDITSRDLGTKITGIDRVCHQLGAEASGLAAVPPLDAGTNHSVAVFVPSASALDLVWVQRPHLAYVGASDGDLILCVEESFALRVMDKTAIAVAAKKG